MKPLASLTAIGALCALLLAGTHRFTADDIEANRDAHAWRVAFELVGTEFPTADLRWDGDRLDLPDGVRLQRSSVNGYAGEIEFLAAFRPEPGRTEALAGVRVTRHRETPGLGDFIDTARSRWIHQFSDKLPDEVDAVTGATITSEAVKRGVSALPRSVVEPPPRGESGLQATPGLEHEDAGPPVMPSARVTEITRRATADPEDTGAASRAVPARQATATALTRPGAGPALPGDNP